MMDIKTEIAAGHKLHRIITPSGVRVIVPDVGNKQLGPQVLAMLQALYSRSKDSCADHIKKAIANAEKFMQQFYVNYGHKSIGQCGTWTVFIEHCSLIAAKAVQQSQFVQWAGMFHSLHQLCRCFVCTAKWWSRNCKSVDETLF